MFNTDQTLPCPVCNTKIPFDAQQLLMGTQFTCSNCNAIIGLANESKPIVENALQQFEQFKGQISNKK
jgi:transcription initiation factor IIE alpha subunit